MNFIRQVMDVLKICTCMEQMDMDKLIGVYDEQIALLEQPDRLLAEMEFIAYLREEFFSHKGAICAIWTEEGNYVSALQLEPFQDGMLLSCLETKPDCRRRGFAERLVQQVIAFSTAAGSVPIYVHIHKKNTASRRLHFKCGFEPLYDFGRLIDGTVSGAFDTLVFKK